jgi:diguanylate cyclase (GGDEF)-like protein
VILERVAESTPLHRLASWAEERATLLRPAGDGFLRGRGRGKEPAEGRPTERVPRGGLDDLTGLPDLALFLEMLERAAGCVASRGRLAILVVDLDRFKLVNEALCPSLGDLLLQGVARRLAACLGPQDVVARLSADEFAVLVPALNHVADATRLAERLHEELRRGFDLGGQEVFTSASIGIATGRAGDADVLRDAFAAMSRAKSQGRGGSLLFDRFARRRPEPALALLRREADLARALDRGEIQVGYQPIVDLAEARLVGFEALARWWHPSRGFVAPQEFIAVAEETGLIVPLGRAVLRRVSGQLAQWRERFGPESAPFVSVNLSPRQLMEAGVVRQVRDALEGARVPGRLLRLEVTESAVFRDPPAAAERLAEIKELGVRISLDDFGTGYSSLSLLHQLPVDAIKIDRSFVSGLEHRPETVRAILGLARSLALEVVAEGVETADQRSALAALGCDYGQGFLFGPALEAEDAAILLQGGGRFLRSAAC